MWDDLPVLRRRKLLRPAGHAAVGLSVLNGGYFESNVRAQFDKIQGTGIPQEAVDMTCLITATAIGGEPLAGCRRF